MGALVNVLSSRCVAPFALRRLHCAICIAPNTESLIIVKD